MGQTLGRAAELVAEWQRNGQRVAIGPAPSVERGAAAVAVEAVGGGGLHRRTSQPRRRNNSAPREHFPPFVFPLPPLSGLYCTFTKQSQNKHNPSTFLKVRQSIYITYTPAEFIIYYTSALLLYYLTRTPPRARLFFSFFFFYFFFSLSLLFFYLFFFFYITFLFFSFFFFSVSLFVFLFYFFFFSIIHFCIRPGGGKGLAFPPLSLLFSPLLAVCAFHNKTHGGVKKI